MNRKTEKCFSGKQNLSEIVTGRTPQSSLEGGRQRVRACRGYSQRSVHCSHAQYCNHSHFYEMQSSSLVLTLSG